MSITSQIALLLAFSLLAALPPGCANRLGQEKEEEPAEEAVMEKEEEENEEINSTERDRNNSMDDKPYPYSSFEHEVEMKVNGVVTEGKDEGWWELDKEKKTDKWWEED